MTDKELIKQEIERRINLIQDTKVTSYADGWIQAYKELLQFIDSLPEESGCEVNFTTKSEDLEEYYKKEFLPNEWFAKPGQRTISQFNFFTAKHFAEWQKQKDFEELLKSDTSNFKVCYEKGRFDMREEMMKDSLNCSIIIHPNDPFANYSVSAYVPPLHKASTYILNGDKVKIIIIKEEQK